MSRGYRVKERRMRKTAILLTACKCMSGRLMALASYLGGGYAGLRRGRTHSACAGEAEAQGIQRLPKKSSRRSALGATSACGTRPLPPVSFSLSFPTPPPSVLHLIAAPFPSLAVGRLKPRTLAAPAKVRRFTSAATLKTQTRCRSRWGRLHCLRVALDMLP